MRNSLALILILSVAFSFCKRKEVSHDDTVQKEAIERCSKYCIDYYRGTDSESENTRRDSAITRNDSWYKDKTTALMDKKWCLQNLMRAFAEMGEFKKVLFYEKEYEKYVGNLDQLDSISLITLSGIKSYIHYSDSLDKIKIASDKKLFLKGKGLQKVGSSHWFTTEQGSHFILDYNAFNELIKKYPKSDYIDDARYELITTHSGDECGANPIDYEEFIKNYPKSECVDNAEFGLIMVNNCIGLEIDTTAKQLKKFIKKYPNSEEITQAEFALWNYLSDKKESEKWCQFLITKYPNDERTNSIKEWLKNSSN
jgi:Outer membrane lipoprotein